MYFVCKLQIHSAVVRYLLPEQVVDQYIFATTKQQARPYNCVLHSKLYHELLKYIVHQVVSVCTSSGVESYTTTYLLFCVLPNHFDKSSCVCRVSRGFTLQPATAYGSTNAATIILYLSHTHTTLLSDSSALLLRVCTEVEKMSQTFH